MYKTTFGPRIHYVLILSLIFLTLSAWTSGGLYAQISITVDSTTAPSCADAADGAINITASGGDGNYSYTWSGSGFSSASADISNLNQGDYTITITDQSSNTTTETIPLDFNDSVDPTVLTSNMTVQLDANGQATITAAEINNNSTDNCGIDSYSLSKSNFTCADVGVNNITLTVTDINGNSASETATVTVEDNLAPSVETSNMTVQLDANGQVSIATADINNNSTDNCEIASYSLSKSNFTCVDVGDNTITLTVTDTNGNSGSNTAVVTVIDDTNPVISAEADITVNNDPQKCEAIVNVTPATASDNCTVSSPTGTRDDGLEISAPYPVGTTIITWAATDANANTAVAVTQQVIVIDNEPPVQPEVENILWGCEYTVETPITTDNCSGDITGTTNNPLTYSTTGTYNITWTFTDAAGNNSQVIQTIEIDELTVNLSKIDILCNGFETGKLTATVDGGVRPYSYIWKNVDNNTNLGTESSVSNLPAGTYSVTVKDLNNCEITKQIEIEQPEILTMAEPTSTLVTCFAGNDGTITVGNMSGGTAPYLYSLDNTNFQPETIFENLTAGEYTIFVKDSNDCTLQKEITVEQPEELSATISKTNVNCFVDADNDPDGTIVITNATGGNSGYEYSIDGSNWQSTPEFSNLTEGNYSVYIRDSAFDCEVFLQEINITQPSAPLTISVNKTRTTSYGSPTATVTANPTGGTAGYTYEWRKYDENNNLGSVFANTKTINNQLAGLYQVTVIDNKGCKKQEDIEIIDKVFVEIIASSLCDDVDNELRTSRFSVNLETLSGGVGPITDFEYTWDFGGGARPESNIGEGEIKVEYDFPGDKIITLTVTDNTNPDGVTSSYTFNHYVGECFEDCGQSMNFDIDRNSFYIGDSSGNPINSNNCSQNNAKFLWVNIIKSSNAYALNTELVYTITDANGNTTQKKAIDCFGTDLDSRNNKYDWQLIPTGNFKLFRIQANSNLSTDIDWECGKSFEIEALSMRYVTNSKKDCGNTNKNQCIGLSDEVGVSTPVIASLQYEDVLCKGELTGSISVSASGGIKPYKYSISGDIDNQYQSTPDFFNLPAGTYNNVWVKDLVGKKIQLPTVKISEPNEIVVTVAKVDPLCFGDFGTAEVTLVTGGTPFSSGEYEYLWNDSRQQSGYKATELEPGEYTVTVTDANGCQVIESIRIEAPPQLTTPNAGEDQNLGCGTFTVSLSANTPDVGRGKWTIDTSTSPSGGQFADANNPITMFTGNEGTYTLIWTIANEDGSCDEDDTVDITFNGECSELDFDGIDDHITIGNVYPLNSNNFSFEIWIKTESILGIQTIFSKRDKANPVGGYELTINNGNPSFKWNGITLNSNSKLTKNKWSHVAVIYKNGSARLYLNGIDVGNTSNASNPTNTNAPFIIGALYDSTSPEKPKNLFNGWMEELRIWNKPLTVSQLRFMMNQRIDLDSKDNSSSIIEGELIPNKEIEGSYNTLNGLNLDHQGIAFYDLTWGSLDGYYRLISNNPDPAGFVNFAENEKPANGFTQDFALSSNPGIILNVETNQENTSPMPYVSTDIGQSSDWDISSTWIRPDVWNIPNTSLGTSQNFINWNIVEVYKDIFVKRDLSLLGLISKKDELKINGDVSGEDGHGLIISHYLKLDGTINLEGNSQLVQSEGSILDDASTGYLDIDQQGTANSFNYNYWTSPVSLQNKKNNSGFKIEEILFNGENGATLDFNYQYHWADNYNFNSEKKRISSYWLNTFQGTADDYFQWKQVAETESINPGIGYSMKGTQGSALLSSHQNYTFRGKPHNGNISVKVGEGQNLLTGNPYPSAIDSQKFIDENAIEDQNFNGSLYFWDHFGYENTHYLEEYVGGYAVLNKSGSVSSASSIDTRINTDTNLTGSKKPGRYIPVGQGFFISTHLVNSPDSIRFKNSYRVFVPESTGDSQFHSQEKDPKKSQENEYEQDTRFKIRLKFESPKGYHRQILVTADDKSTNSFDLGYDAPLIENNVEDMYWMIDSTEFVIQAVPDFNLEQVLPIGIKISEQGEYTIKIDELENIEMEFNVYLKDKSNDTYFNLTKEDYKATAEELGYFNDRYEIVFKEPQAAEEEEEEEEDIVDEKPIEEKPEELDELPLLDLRYVRDTDEIAVINPDLMNVDRVELYSISGQLIKTFNEVPTEESIMLSIDRKLSSAVYIVKMYSGEESYSRKVIITN